MQRTPSTTRRRYTAAQRLKFVSLYRQSGLTQSEFARQHQLKLCTLHQWLHRATLPTAPARAPIFKEILLAPPPPTHLWSAEIVVGDQFTLRLGSHVSARLITQVIDRLRRPC